MRPAWPQEAYASRAIEIDVVRLQSPLKTRLSAEQKSQMMGNSFSAIAVARLLVSLVADDEQAEGHDLTATLWKIWRRNKDKVYKVQHEDKPWKLLQWMFLGLAASEWRSVDLQAFHCGSDPERRLSDEELLVYLLTRNGTHRGTEIRIDVGMPYAVGEMTRHSIDPTSWTWKVLMAYAWKRKDQHINVLEMVAVLDLLRKLVRNVKRHNSRMVILVDSQVALSVLTKGRTSAKALQSPIRRVSAVLLASEVLACYRWIKSSWNPADVPSRWVQRRNHA